MPNKPLSHDSIIVLIVTGVVILIIIVVGGPMVVRCRRRYRWQRAMRELQLSAPFFIQTELQLSSYPIGSVAQNDLYLGDRPPPTYQQATQQAQW